MAPRAACAGAIFFTLPKEDKLCLSKGYQPIGVIAPLAAIGAARKIRIYSANLWNLKLPSRHAVPAEGSILFVCLEWVLAQSGNPNLCADLMGIKI